MRQLHNNLLLFISMKNSIFNLISSSIFVFILKVLIRLCMFLLKIHESFVDSIGLFDDYLNFESIQILDIIL